MNNKPKTLEEAIEMFDNGDCNCRFIITTPRHTRGDCPHYGYSFEKELLTTIWHAGRGSVVETVKSLKQDDSFAREVNDNYLIRYKDGYNTALENVITKLSELKGNI